MLTVAVKQGLLFIIMFGLSVSAWSAPPPWAPAYGYYKDKGKDRNKGNKHHKKNKEGYRENNRASMSFETGPFLTNGTCNRQEIGKVLGTVVGGVLGSRIGDGDGRKIATILGSVIGYVVAGNIGRHMDDADQLCTGQALEYTEDSRPVVWKNPDTGKDYTVTPTRTYERDSGYCREFTTETSIGKQVEMIYGVACRQSDGSWKMVR